jgi:hypothetical protein
MVVYVIWFVFLPEDKPNDVNNNSLWQEDKPNDVNNHSLVERQTK